MTTKTASLAWKAPASPNLLNDSPGGVEVATVSGCQCPRMETISAQRAGHRVQTAEAHKQVTSRTLELTPREAFELAYGRPAEDWEAKRLRDFGYPDIPGPAIHQLRAVILSFERNTHPTPLHVHFGSEDLATLDLTDFRFNVDRRDHAVSGGVIAQGWLRSTSPAPFASSCDPA